MNALLTVALILGGVAGGFFGHDLLTQADFDELERNCTELERAHVKIEAEGDRYFQTCLTELETEARIEVECVSRLKTCQGIR